MRYFKPSVRRFCASLFLINCLCPFAAAQAAVKMPPGYIVGADISWVQQREAAGMKYSDNGVQKDILQILKDHGFNYIRLRVFNDPTIATWNPTRGGGARRGGRGATSAPASAPAVAIPTTGPAAIQAMRLSVGQAAYSPQGYCDLPHTIEMAKRVKAAGMGLLIDFHYSDSWADPGKQFTPTAWFTLPFPELVKTTHDWTRDCLMQMKAAGCAPDMVQVGNEITPGMMNDRPDGGGSARNWEQLGQLLKAGLSAVKEVDPNIKTMLHIDQGGNNAVSVRWLDNAFAQGVQVDVFGESCYQRWQGPPEGWKANFADLAKRYPKLKFVMAEVDAQALVANEIMLGLPNNQGLGTFIWEPTANNANQGLFDNQGNVIPEKMAQYDEVMKKYGPAKP
jgi:arabinogalactan endo-1,4-beta-galactosidase